MSDVRALLKAKRQETRVAHPLASYSSSGQLRCAVCAIAIKHASAWDGHVASKAHRVNVLKMKESEESADVPDTRKAQDDDDGQAPTPKKRRIDEQPSTSQRSSGAGAGASTGGGFPADFFSDPARAPQVLASHGSDEEEEEEGNRPPAVPAGGDVLDLEWAQFQQAVLSAPPVPVSAQREAYERATVVAEPQLAETMEGLPSQQPPNTEGSPAHQPPDEEQLRRLKEHEERELIMDRMLEEERVQEEADAKVMLLKRKLDVLKQKRQAARAANKS